MSQTILRKVPDEDVYYNFEDYIETTVGENDVPHWLTGKI